MTTNVKTRKFDKLTIAAIIAVVALVLGTLLPCFAFPETVVYDSSFIITERTNMHFNSVLLDVVIIDENGRVDEDEVRVYLEGEETEYRFTNEDLQKILETEDEVYIKGVTEKALLHCSFFTPVVGFFYAVLALVAVISMAFVGIWGAEAFLKGCSRFFKNVKRNLSRKRKQPE